MTATLISTSSEAEWLEARRHGVTASEIAVLMGLSPYSSPYALYHRKLGTLPEQEDNVAMAIGRHFEDFVAAQFAERHPHLALMGSGRELYAHPGRPWQMATPDRTVHEFAGITEYTRTVYGDLLAVLECKTDGGYDGWGDDGSDEIPVHYRCQVLWQMDVLGVQTGFVACLYMHRRQLRVYELTIDAQARADLELMRYEAMAFMLRLDNQKPPDVDWRPATSDALKRLHPSVEDTDVAIPWRLAGWYRGACRQMKDAERRKRLYENRIRLILGSGRRAVSGRDEPSEVIARRDVYDLPEKQITRKASTVDRLVPVTPKEPS